jgi:hypothetical protein
MKIEKILQEEIDHSEEEVEEEEVEVKMILLSNKEVKI